MAQFYAALPSREKKGVSYTHGNTGYVARGASGGVCKEEALAAVSAVSTPSLPRCRGEGAGRGPKPSYLDPSPPHVYSRYTAMTENAAANIFPQIFCE